MKRNQKLLPGCINSAITGVLVGLMATPGQLLQAQSLPAPVVLYRTVNDGATQRSTVTNLSAIFSTNVTLTPSNLVVRPLGQNTPLNPTNFALTYDTASNKATWTFPGLPGRSLPDGNFSAAILANTVSNASGVRLDGDADGASGDPHVFDLFRKFGDWNGDRDVDFLDDYWFQKSREADAPLPLRSIFDDNGSGPEDPAALAHFQTNYFTILPAQPSIFAALVNDSGSSPLDNVTTDPTIAGAVIRTNPAATLEARTALSANWVDVTSALSIKGSFRFDSNRLAEIKGSALNFGSNVLFLRLQETNGTISATFELGFVLESPGTCAFTNGWIVAASPTGGMPGSVSFADCFIELVEGDSFLVSAERIFTIPALPSTLNITYSQLNFDSTMTNLMRDALEVALVDGAGRPLTYTIQGSNAVTSASVSTPPVLPPSPDGCFNHTDGHTPFNAPGTALQFDITNPQSKTLAIDVSHLPPGSAAQLILRLINNDRDRATTVRISDVKFDTAPLMVTGFGLGQPLAAFNSPVGHHLLASGNLQSCDANAKLHPSTALQNASAHAVSPAQPGTVVAYNPATGFSLASNPNGVWSYGYFLAPTSQLILHESKLAINGVDIWRTDISASDPLILHNTTLVPVSLGTPVIDPGGLALHPGPNNELAVLRFTAPATGQYHVYGSFFGQDIVGTTTDVHILIDGHSRFDGLVTGFGPGSGPVFDTTVPLKGGSRLDFVVGFGNNSSYFYDTTGLSLQIEKVPMPSSLAISIISPTDQSEFAPGIAILTGYALANRAQTSPTNSLERFDGFGNISRLQLNGVASVVNTSDGTVLRVCPAAPFLAGGAFTKAKFVAQCFSTYFSFRITNPGGVLGDCNAEAGADGLAFVVQSDGSASLGDSGGYLGFRGITDSVGIEFDTYCNSAFNDPNSNHVGIDTNGTVDHGLGAPNTRNVAPSFDDGNVWHAWVDYDGTNLDVRVNQTGIRPVSPTLTQALDIPAVIRGQEAYFGFTSGTGAGWENYDVIYWEHTQPCADEITDLPNRIILVTVNGAPVDALDAAGNFFSAIEMRPGQNVFEVVATDAFNQSTTNTVTVYGTTCPQNFTSLSEVSASVVPEYGRTSFNEWTKVLYADLALRNAGTYPIRAPIYVGVTRISDPSVRLLSPDGVSADGIPFYDYTAALANGALDIGHSSLPRALAFHNPNRVQFTYDLAVLGQLNQAPAFTTTPVLEAIVGTPYTYPFNATDPDGDPLTYSLLTSPTGMVLNAQFSTLKLQPSINQIGTHDIRLRSDDGKGGLAEQHYLLNVISPPSNRPPYFVSTPVTVARVTPATGGKVIVCNDEWPFSDEGFGRSPEAGLFVTNLMTFFLGERHGRILAYTPNFSVTGFHFNRVLRDLGHEYFVSTSVPFTLTNFLTYDVLIVGGWPADNQVLLDYVGAGGNVYLLAGTGITGAFGQDAEREAQAWDTFMAGIGLRFERFYNGIIATFPISNSPHPIFADQPRLYIGNGNSIIDLNPNDDQGSIIATLAGNGLFAVFDSRFTGSSDSGYTYDAAAVDPDGDATQFSLLAFPRGMWIDASSGLIRWAPNTDQIGDHDVTVQVHDGRSGTNYQSYRICVLPDQTPVFVPQSVDLAMSEVNKAGVIFDRQALTASGTASAIITNHGPGDIHVPFEVTFFEDRNTNGLFEVGIDSVLGKTSVAHGLASGQALAVPASVSGVVRFAGVPLWAFVDSDGNVAESDEINNLARDGCEGTPQAGQFNPVIKWKKESFSVAPASDQVMMTPAVADLDANGMPDIIFLTFSGAGYDGSGVLRAISGEDGTELWGNPNYNVHPGSQIAVGDIDGDHRLEIVAIHNENRVIVFNHDGSFKWQTPVLARSIRYGAPALADLDADGRPEIIVGAYVISNSSGTVLWDGITNGGRGTAFGYSVVADLDMDGTPEVVAGNTAYRANGSILWTNSVPDGFVAIGNFDNDAFPEIIVVGNNVVFMIEHDGLIKWGPINVFSNGGGGPPTIADLNGDGQPDIGLAGRSTYVALSGDGSILWANVTEDFSSASTGSSVFDFDGDGTAEVVYGDELKLWIYGGPDGRVIYKLDERGSGTLQEYPVVVDVDADGNAEIVVAANNYYRGTMKGIVVIGDRNDTWVSTRKIWNQHSYHISNVNDDGTIPRYETNSWQTHNTYRLNALPTESGTFAAPDLVPSLVRIATSNSTLAITVRIGNGGVAPVTPGLEVAFYSGTPRADGILLGKTPTLTRLLPGAYEDVTFNVQTNAASDLWIVADDDGSGRGIASECNETNNYYHPDIALPWTGRPPQFTSAPVTNATEGQTYRYDAEAIDPDASDTFVFSLVLAPAGMTIDSSSGLIIWSPAASQNRLQPVAIAVEDSRGAQNFQSYFIQVQDALNVTPQFVSSPPTNAFATQLLAYQPGARDADGDPLHFDLISAPQGMLLDTNATALIWRPLLGQLGVHDVILRVQDDRGGVALQSWQIAVAGPNSAPVITTFPPGPAVVDLPYRYHVRAQDAEGEVLSFSLGSNAPVGMMLTIVTNAGNGSPSPGGEGGQSAVLSWSPTLANVGSTPIEIIVRDEHGEEARQVFNLEVTPPGAPNRAPRFVSAPRTQTRLGLDYIYQVQTADPDGDLLVLSLPNGPTGMVLTNGSLSPPGEGILAWRPQELGTFPVSIVVNDGRPGGVVTQQFAFTVTSTLNNSAPVIVSQPSLHATDGQPYEYELAATDVDDDTITWRLVNGPLGMSLDPVTGALRWSPTLDQLGTNTVTVEARDALFATATQTWFIKVGCVNRPPQITSIPPTQANVDEPYLYALRAEDPDGDALTFSFISTNEVPFGMTISNLTSTATSGLGGALIRWTPTTNQVGAYLVRLRVRDGRGGENEQRYNLYVINERANKAPVIVSAPPRGATVDRPFSYTVVANDPDGDALTFQLLQAPAGAALSQSALQWIPALDQLGSHDFIIVARDPSGASASQRFSVLVRSNLPPVITSTPRTNTVPGTTYRYDVRASDPDGDALIYAFASSVPSGMSIDTLGRISWSPNLAQTGAFPITITAADAFGASASQSFSVTVATDAEPPAVELTLVQGLVNTGSGQWAARLGSTVQVRVDASDNVGVATRALYLGGTPVALSGGNVATLMADRTGVFDLTGQATDLTGNSNSVTRTISFFDPLATNQLTIRIHNPTNDSVITAPVDVVATITNDGPIVSYSWGYALLADVDPNGVSITHPAFTILGTSNLPPNTTRLENIVVGRFDPTVLNNDSYVLAVAATDAAAITTTEPIAISVQGNLKFGEFRLEFTDLAIPVAGIPITVRRIYDSRDAKRVGDFGHGWSLAVQDAIIRESVPAERSFRPNTRVYLTSPDGRRQGYTFAPTLVSASLFGAIFTPRFVGDPGVYDQLEVPDEQFSFEGAGLIGDLFESFGPYNPDTYFLTTRDGTRYEYNQSTGLRIVTDRNGNRIEYTGDGIFHYNAGSAESDQSVRFIRDARGRIQRIIDPNGKALTYTYDSLGDLRSFADQVTNTTRYFYSVSRAHFLTNIVDPLGRSALRMEYDSAGRLKTVLDANGNPIAQDFDAGSKSATFTDGNGTVIHTRYDDNGNEVLRRIDGVYTNTFAYDANNNLLASTNGRGFSTNYNYDARGNVTSIRDLLGNRTSIAYNDQNKPVGVTNALGQILNLSYNSSGQLTQVVNNAGLKTSVSRDAQGRVASLTDATGTNTTTFDYSNGCACGRPGKVINPDGSFRLYEYNSQGLTNRVVNELGAETLFHHDDSGKLLWMRDPLTNFTYFHYNGPLLTNVVDALGRSTRYEYDALNRTNKIIDAEGGVIEFRYDNNGNRTHVIDAVTNVTTFVYDAANRLTQQIDPLGHTNFFSYDAAGNRTGAIDRNGRKRTFAFDAANRMTNELWWEGTNVVRSIVFGFNELGVQTFAADPAARYEYSYDALNRLERVLSQSAGVPDFTLLYTYTALGQVASVTDHWGVRVGSGYDERNRLASRTWSSTLPGAGVDPARVDFAYDPSGNRVRTDRFADLAGTNRIGFTTNAYNRAGIVTNITHLGPASQVLAKYDYNFDAAYQITRWAIGNQLSDFAYDRTGQLTNALNTSQPDENFRFDANGNRVGAQSGGSYVVGGNNQILYDGTNNYAYDAEGNMTSRSNTVTGVLTTHQFDHRNRLVSVLDSNPGGVVTQTVAFVYDAMNRRLAKTVNGQQNTNIARFLYNQGGSWADLDGTNAITARYLHGGRIDELVARHRATDGIGWYLIDHLRTVRDITTSFGTVIGHIEYSSFGEVLTTAGTSALDRFRFTGRELDSETGLYFYRARFYSPPLGRFINPDPFGFAARDVNLYRYVANNPAIYADPAGLLLENVILRGAFIGALFGGTGAAAGGGDYRAVIFGATIGAGLGLVGGALGAVGVPALSANVIGQILSCQINRGGHNCDFNEVSLVAGFVAFVFPPLLGYELLPQEQVIQAIVISLVSNAGIKIDSEPLDELFRGFNEGLNELRRRGF